MNLRTTSFSNRTSSAKWKKPVQTHQWGHRDVFNGWRHLNCSCQASWLLFSSVPIPGPRDLQEGYLTAAISMCMTGCPGVCMCVLVCPIYGHCQLSIQWLVVFPDPEEIWEKHRSLTFLQSLQSPDPVGLWSHPSPLAWSYPSLEFFSRHKSLLLLFPVPVYCCTCIPSLYFHSEDYKFNVHNHTQDYNAYFCEDKIIPHSGKVRAEKLLHKRQKKWKATGF